VSVVALAEATDPGTYGGKAAQLGAARRAGLPVPDGFALSCEAVDLVSSGALDLLAPVADAWLADRPLAVRSSAVGEDSGTASFAGTHVTVLGVCGTAALVQAVRQVRASAADAGALAYRNRLGLDRAPMCVVVQELVDADVAGVLFTRNPVTGADERVVEASWGLGEAVVSGLVTPDHYVLDRTGSLREVVLGEKDLAVRRVGPGTVEVPVADDLVGTPCLGTAELTALHELVTALDDVFGEDGHDVEFAFRDGRLHLLQRRPITRG
jgi:pyruvate,water dikinase